MVDFNLTASQLELQKRAREFAIKEILPIVNYFDEGDQMPLFVIKKAWEAGLMNLEIPKEYKGKDLPLLDSALVVEEIAAACPGMATSIFGNTLGQEPIILCKNEPLKQKYLPMFTNEFKMISFATSETMMGSDVAGMRCKAEKDGDDFIVTGTKYWVTNGGFADYYSIFATSDPKARHDGICGLLIDRKWPGVVVGEHIPKMGLRTSNTVALKLEKVRVPKECVLAPPGGEGFKLAMKTFSRTRPIIGSFAVGAARSAMEFALEYSKKRKAFGQNIGDFQSIAFKLAEMYQKVETSRLLTWRSACEADAGRDPTIWASMTKYYATESALEVINDAMQILGGYGYTRFFPIEKLLRDIRILMIYEGTSQVQRIVLSKFLNSSYKPIMPPMEDIARLKADNVEQAAREGMKDQIVWRCRICGYIHYGPEAPDECPYCRFPKTAFKKVHPKV